MNIRSVEDEHERPQEKNDEKNICLNAYRFARWQ
jgi:hypothetical protein